MNWHIDVLPEAQRRIWDSKISRGFSDFVLYGGTALALRLGHRQSVDFDFFSSRTFAPLDLKEELGLEGETVQAEPNTLTLFHHSVKISFFGGLTLGMVDAPDRLEECSVASIRDLAGCKLAALVNRVELKDYLDVVAILNAGFPLAELLASAIAIYRGAFPVAVCAKSLVYFDPPELASLREEHRATLENAVRSLGPVEPLSLALEQITPMS